MIQGSLGSCGEVWSLGELGFVWLLQQRLGFRRISVGRSSGNL